MFQLIWSNKAGNSTSSNLLPLLESQNTVRVHVEAVEVILRWRRYTCTSKACLQPKWDTIERIFIFPNLVTSQSWTSFHVRPSLPSDSHSLKAAFSSSVTPPHDVSLMKTRVTTTRPLSVPENHQTYVLHKCLTMSDQAIYRSIPLS